jgi:hypothetical protein
MAQGAWFDKKTWDGAPLPRWEEARERLPLPVHDERPQAVEAWIEAWRRVIGSVRQPTPANGFVSNHLFMPFNDCVFAHDTAVMSLFARYGNRVMDPAGSFDNFYAKQHETGEICREIRCSDGSDYWRKSPADPVTVRTALGGGSADYRWTRPTVGTHPPGVVEIDGLNDPCALLWGEMACRDLTGDDARLHRILPAQKRWYQAFTVYLRDMNGLFITDWASADNHPRNPSLGYGVDVACQAALLARLLSAACAVCRDPDGRRYAREAAALSRRVRQAMWDEERGFFLDLDRDGRKLPFISVFGFWPLIAGVATRRQAARLAGHLRDPREFDRPVLVPSLAASEHGYSPTGSYYLGGVWPFTNAMVIEGLERYGMAAEARRIALNFWEASQDVFTETGTFWEYLQPEARAPGRSLEAEGWNARPEFTGWGAWAPISLLVEHVIGLRVDAPRRTVTWNLASTRQCGCRSLAFGDVVTDLIAEPRAHTGERPRIQASSNAPYTLVVRWGGGRSARMRVG